MKRERAQLGPPGAVLALILAAGLVIAWNALYVTETREDYFVLKETVDGDNYLYVELPWEGRLLRLRCVGDVDFDGIALEDEGGCELVYDLDCRWNRLTYEGTVSRCDPTESFVVGHMEGSSSGASLTEVFGMENVLYTEMDYHQNPHGEGFLCEVVYWLHDGPVDPGLLDIIVDGNPGYPVDYARPCWWWRTVYPPHPGTWTATGRMRSWSVPAGRKSPTPSTTMWTETCRRLPGRTPCRRRSGTL